MANKKSSQKTMMTGLSVALIFVLVGVFIFSSSMETLDKQAEQMGAQEQSIYEPPFPDYVLPGVNNVWGALLIGIAGTLLLFVTGLGAAKVLHMKKGQKP